MKRQGRVSCPGIKYIGPLPDETSGLDANVADVLVFSKYTAQTKLSKTRQIFVASVQAVSKQFVERCLLYSVCKKKRSIE
jgi:hypothetical protein